MAGKFTIRWQSDPQLSVIHAAYVVATDAVCSDRKTHQALVGPATEINNRLLSASIDVATFWDRLFAEYAFDPGHARICEIALTDAGCSELQLEQTAGAISNCLAECRLAFLARFPKLSEQLQLRSKPMIDRWKQVGSSLLSEIASQIWHHQPPDDWWPSRAVGLLVQPIRGGDGNFDADSRKFWVEAVLNDVDPAVPEILRVAWLVTQLTISLQMREKSSVAVTGMPWSLGAVPLVLSAAAKIELTADSDLPIAPAMALWRLGDAATAATVGQWWDQWQKKRDPDARCSQNARSNASPPAGSKWKWHSFDRIERLLSPRMPNGLAAP